MKNYRKAVLSVVATFLISSFVFAQGPGLPVDGTGDTPDTGVPFDGGITLMIAACVGVGVKAARKKNKATTEEVSSVA